MVKGQQNAINLQTLFRICSETATNCNKNAAEADGKITDASAPNCKPLSGRDTGKKVSDWQQNTTFISANGLIKRLPGSGKDN